jgi:hypothetical protein
MSNIFFISITIISGICINLYALKYENLRFPIAIYSGMYCFTVLIGALMLGLNITDAWDIVKNYGANVNLFQHDKFDFNYWFVLFSPLFFPILIAIIFQSINHNKLKFSFSIELNPLMQFAFLLTFSLLCLVVLDRLLVTYANIDFTKMKILSNYNKFIYVRKELIENLGTVIFGIIYRTLPTLSYIALFQACKKPGFSWKIIFLSTFGIVVILSILIAQKSPLLIYLLTLGIGIVIAKKWKIYKLTLFAAALIFLFVLYQTIILPHGNFLYSLKLLIFRMACGYPYYLSIYPKIIPFGQLDFGLDILGLTDKINMTSAVFQYMYPPNIWGWGDVPASAHVMAYARGGIPYSLLCLILIGFSLALISCIKDNDSNAFSFATFLSTLTFLYYVTQTSLQDSLVSCYGIVFSFIGIILLLLISRLMKLAISMSHRNTKNLEKVNNL